MRSCVSKQVPFKVLLQAALALLTWWAIGHGLAFGERPREMRPNGFVGSRDFFLSAREDPAALDSARFAVWMTQVRPAGWARGCRGGVMARGGCAWPYRCRVVRPLGVERKGRLTCTRSKLRPKTWPSIAWMGLAALRCCHRNLTLPPRPTRLPRQPSPRLLSRSSLAHSRSVRACSGSRC